MTKQAISEQIQTEAKKIKITPKFLLFAVAALSKRETASEFDVLHHYYKSLATDMEEAAREQCKSYNSNFREAGKEALKENSDELNKEAFAPVFGAAALNSLIQDEKPLKLHYVAWEHLLKDRQKIYKLARLAKYESKELDAIQIVKNLYPDLISKMKLVAGFFKNADLNFN